MAAPPPPPPPGPSIPAFLSKPSQGDGRGLLLESIRKGTNLKKTVTNDKSAPLVAGKSINKSPTNANASTISRNGGTHRANDSPPAAVGLGGLFVNGIPKLKATGLPIGQAYQQYRNENDASKLNSVVNNKLSNTVNIQKMNNNINSINGTSNSNHNTSSLTRLRGPPPQPPGLPPKLVTPEGDAPNGLPVHAKSGSAISLSENSYHSRASEDGQHQVISHGKPSLAPKPPSIINKTDGRPSVSRTQSMRNPRTSISVSEIKNDKKPQFIDQPEAYRMNNKNGFPSFHQSQESLSLSRRYNRSTSPNRPPSNAVSWGSSLNTGNATLRPHNRAHGSPLRPPLTKPPPPPSSRAVVCPPMCPPPPPPTHAPPPPPHRLNPAPPPPPSVVQNRHTANHFTNSGAPPQPPIRNSSMRSSNSGNISSFETRFMKLFHTMDEFPAPQPFQNVPKIYNSKIQAKQQAPQPPIKSGAHPANRSWQAGENTSKC